MADIFDEISEDLRRQQMLGMWKSYGKYLIAALVLIVVAVGAYEYSKYRARVIAERDSEAFGQAVGQIESGRTEDGLAALAQLRQDGSAGYRFLAGIRAGEVHSKAGDRAAAIRVLEETAGDSGIDRVLRDYAELQAVSLAVDEPGRADLRQRLDRLAQPGAAWAPLAEELLAYLDLKAGDDAAARERLERVAANEEAPMSLRARAREMLALLSGTAAAAPAPDAPAAAAEEEPQS